MVCCGGYLYLVYKYKDQEPSQPKNKVIHMQNQDIQCEVIPEEKSEQLQLEELNQDDDEDVYIDGSQDKSGSSRELLKPVNSRNQENNEDNMLKTMTPNEQLENYVDVPIIQPITKRKQK